MKNYLILSSVAIILGYIGVFLTFMCVWEWFGDFWHQNLKTLLWSIVYIVFFIFNIYLVKNAPAFLQGFVIQWWHYLVSNLFFLFGTAISAKGVFRL